MIRWIEQLRTFLIMGLLFIGLSKILGYETGVAALISFLFTTFVFKRN
jgi:hypothetical protein